MFHICGLLTCKAMGWCLFFKMWRSHSARLLALDLKKFCGAGTSIAEGAVCQRHVIQREETSTNQTISTNSVLRNVPCDSRALYSKRARPRRRSLLGPLTAPAKNGMGNEDLATRARFKLDDCSIRDIENNRTARFNIVQCRTFMVSTLGSFGIVGVGLIGSEFGVAFCETFFICKIGSIDHYILLLLLLLLLLYYLK